MEAEHNIKGLRLRRLNAAMLVISSILFIIVFYTTYQVSQAYEKNLAATRNVLIWDEAERTVGAGTVYLTDQARLFVQTHEKKYADNFFRKLNEKSREDALRFLTSHDLHVHANGEQCHLKMALDLSNKLAMREAYAMRLVVEGEGEEVKGYHKKIQDTNLSSQDQSLSPEDKFALASEMVFGPEYQKAKKEINEQLEMFTKNTVSAVKRQQAEEADRLGHVLAEQKFALIGLFIMNVLTFMMIIVLIIKPLQIYLNCIKNDKMLELIGAYEFKHLAFTYNDIFSLKEHHEKMIRYKAEHDQLTGMLNRNALESIRELNKNIAEPVGVILIDVDHFKEINDTWGHAVGDQALCRVSSLLRENFRSEDYCIRYGGDEFLIIVKGNVCKDENTIKNKIETINQQLENPPEDFPKLSISVGVASSRRGFNDKLLKEADIALYEVKEAGRRGCRFYHADGEDDTAEPDSEEEPKEESGNAA